MWGIWALVDPQWLFQYAGMPLMNQPVVFSCLGMVIGLYGVVYAEVARVPERGFVLAAAGLAGKVLGPVGWLYLYSTGRWPGKSVVMIVSNDLIWWVPFSLYLKDVWPLFLRDLMGPSDSRRENGGAGGVTQENEE